MNKKNVIQLGAIHKLRSQKFPSNPLPFLRSHLLYPLKYNTPKKFPCGAVTKKK